MIQYPYYVYYPILTEIDAHSTMYCDVYSISFSILLDSITSKSAISNLAYKISYYRLAFVTGCLHLLKQLDFVVTFFKKVLHT